VKRALAVAALLVASIGLGAAPRSQAAERATANPTPLLAYYYIWFNPSSWNRAKRDLPLLGSYSSDDTQVMRQHVRWAKAAGINGFLVSWKSTATLDDRLSRLIQVADEEHFHLGIVYEGLDFSRKPLPIATVRHDFQRFAGTYAADPAFAIFNRPLVIWSGTWRYSEAEIRSVTASVRSRLLVLASAKDERDYARVARYFDGDAYYWSSVNPRRYPDYGRKLRGLAAKVHATGGLWIAPAAPGFDARQVGGTSVVPRLGGDTLRKELNTAASSSPDAIGVISWNEFSENTFVEPSHEYGSTALKVIAQVRGAQPPDVASFDSEASGVSRSPLGVSYGIMGLVVGCAGLVALTTVARRRRRSRPRPLTKRPSPRV
jgi:hypothetical protein